MVDGVTPLHCPYSHGFTKMRRAGKTTKNAGRFYYQCPLNWNHPGSFMWCDEYARNEEAALFGLSLNTQNPYPRVGVRVAFGHDDIA